MKTTVVDLLTDSGIFKSSKELKTSLDCKFVLLSSSDDELILIFGPLREFSYHAKLIEYFCDQYNIHAGWTRRPDLFEIFSSQYKINGGGWFRFDFNRQLLSVTGSSTAYGRFNQEKMTIALNSADFVDGLEIKVTD